VKQQDEVLRREMTQFEGALATHSKIQSSKRRIERLGFFGSVDLSNSPVLAPLIRLIFDVVLYKKQAPVSIQRRHLAIRKKMVLAWIWVSQA